METKIIKIDTESEYNEAVIHYEHLKNRETLSSEEIEYKKDLIKMIDAYGTKEWDKQNLPELSKEEVDKIRKEEFGYKA